MTIDTLLFDLDNTLINTRDLLKAWSNSIDKEVYYRFYPEHSYQNMDDLTLQKQFFNALLKKTEKLHLRADFQNYVLEKIQPKQEEILFLKSLQPNFKMAIVSNGNAKIQQQKIKRSGLNTVFSFNFFSGQFGVRKPDARLFQKALNKLESRPENTLFIGDSLENDIAGAASIGMKTCWLNKNTLPDNYPLKPTYTVNKLCNINGLLFK